MYVYIHMYLCDVYIYDIGGLCGALTSIDR